jgi:hypothetical protein
LLLQVSKHIDWMTPAKRSQEYVNKIAEELKGKYFLNKKIVSLVRSYNETNKRHAITVIDSQGQQSTFDKVVFACHPDEALEILGEQATIEERECLGAFKYNSNDTYVHSDPALMPQSKAAWTSWNYMNLSDKSEQTDESRPVFVSYWLNKLQHLDHPRDIFVSLNPTVKPRSDLVHAHINYAHPQYSLEAIAAQKEMTALQGKMDTFFCGAYLGYGFHEDGFRSGLEVAMAISRAKVPWFDRVYGDEIKETGSSVALKGSVLSNFASFFLNPLQKVFENFCREQIFRFLSKRLSKGKLVLIMPDQKRVAFTAKGDELVDKVTAMKNDAEECEPVVIKVKNSWFFVRLALEADIGMAKSFVANEWSMLAEDSPFAQEFASNNDNRHYDQVTRFLELLIENMPNGKDRLKGGIDASQLLTSLIGRAINWLAYRFTMDNSIANSQSNIHAVSCFLVSSTFI